jgi:hypothetical protein
LQQGWLRVQAKQLTPNPDGFPQQALNQLGKTDSEK